MRHTANTAGLAPVQIEPNGHGGADVWLRINIEETTDEDGNPCWEADETHGIVSPVPTVEEIEADFVSWWVRLEERVKSDKEMIAELMRRAQEQEDAIVELAELQVGEV